MKKSTFLKSILIITAQFWLPSTIFSQAIPIPPSLFGTNAWFIDASNANVNSFAATFTAQLSAVKASGVTFVRIGGIAPNWDQLYNFDPISLSVPTGSVTRLEFLISEIRKAGMEPIIQVSCAPPQWTANANCSTYSPASGYNSLGNLNIAQQASVAANVVEYINVTSSFSSNPVIYWSIANEPDFSPQSCSFPGGYGLNGLVSVPNDAAVIAAYTRTFSELMKAKCPKIKIMGPELASFGSDMNYSVNKIMAELASPTTSANSIMGLIPGKTAPDGYYVDVLTFHHYVGPSCTSASDVMNEPAQSDDGMKGVLKNTNTNRKGLIDMISNSGRDASNISIACTELNIDNTTTLTSIDESSNRTGVINGTDNRSFLGGQWLCETYAEAMKQSFGPSSAPIPWVSMLNLWSVKEGECAKTSTSNPLGYISSCSLFDNTKRPMYWHYEMMANNFKGVFYSGTSNQTNVKAFGAKSGDRIAVMILNQSGNNYDFGVNLNGAPTSSLGTLQIAFTMTAATAGTNYIADGSNSTTKAEIKANSTILLIYDCVGNVSERRDYTRAAVLASVNASPVVTSLGPSLIGSQWYVYGTPIITGACGTYSFAPSNLSFNWLSPGPCGGTVISTSSGQNATLCNCNSPGSTQYTFVVSDANGCSATEMISISPTGVPVGGGYYEYLGSITAADCGQNNGFAFIGYGGGGTPTCVWDNGSPTSCGNSTLSSGPHVVVSNYLGGYTTYNFYVPEKNKPPVFAGNDFYSGNYCTTTLSAWPDNPQGLWTYEWYKGNSTLPFYNTADPPYPSSSSVAVQHWGTTDYKVVVWASSTCSNSSTVRVTGYGDCRRKSSAVAALPCPPPSGRPSGLETDTLRNDTIYNVDQYISKPIYVPSGVSFEISNCELAMAADASITVASGGTLIVSRVFVHPCIDDRWKGIYHYGGSGKLKINNSIVDGGPIVAANLSSFEVSESGLYDSGTAIDLENCPGFVIKSNTFEEVSTAIKTHEFGSSSLTSKITENYFVAPDTALKFKDDDHSHLFISCNRFENYTAYAIHSDNTTLQNQGSSSFGPGNYFQSGSSETNNVLWHNGPAMTYYYDPSNTVDLDMTAPQTASAVSAADDGVCPDLLLERQNLIADIKNEESNLNIGLSPNPFTDELSVNFPENTSLAEIKIIEAGSGIQVMRLTNINREQNYTFSTRGINPGFYICSVITTNGFAKQFKMVKVE